MEAKASFGVAAACAASCCGGPSRTAALSLPLTLPLTPSPSSGWTAAFCSVPMHAPESHTPHLAPLGLIAWLFYLSKGYEVVDSIILVLKGKKVSNLQSYHHAGAMWTMWAGVRYSAT